MTREEEIREAIKTLQVYVCGDNGIFECSECIDSDIQNAFYQGVKWADKHPKSPWISVKDDLPCNHEELIFLGGLIDDSETIDVFVRYESGDIWCDYMIYTNGKWKWSDGEPDYWMIAPKLPKE